MTKAMKGIVKRLAGCRGEPRGKKEARKKECAAGTEESSF
jgi:hypothetical protein